MGFPTAYAGPPLTGSGGLVLLVGFRGEKRLANGSLGRRKIPAFRGGGGRAQRAQSMGGALGPAHALVLRVWGALGPPRPAKRRRPPRNPTATLDPPPALVWRPYGGCPGTQEGRGGHGGRRSGAGHRPAAGGWASPTRRPGAHPHGNLLPPPALAWRPYGGCPGGRKDGTTMRGGGGVWRPGGRRPHGLPNKRAGPGVLGPGPRSFRTLRVQPPPPSAGFSANAKKATQKPGLSVYPAPLRPPPEKRW